MDEEQKAALAAKMAQELKEAAARMAQRDPSMETEGPGGSTANPTGNTGRVGVVQVQDPSTILMIQLALITEGVQDRIDDAISNFEYVGFSPMECFAMLRRREQNSATFQSDMAILVAIATTRGTKIAKIARTLNSERMEQFRSLVIKYDVKETGSGRLKGDVATLARLTAIFPVLGMMVCRSEKYQPPEFGKAGLENYPKYLMFPAAGALISQFDDAMRKGYLRWCGHFARRIQAATNYELNNQLLCLGDPVDRERMYNLMVYDNNHGIRATYSNGSRLADSLLYTTQDAINLVVGRPEAPPPLDVESLGLPAHLGKRRRPGFV